MAGRATAPAILALLLALAACRQAPPAAENMTNASPDREISKAGALARYVGAYPFDRVDRRRFIDEPAVRDAIRRLAPDAAVAARVLAEDGPRTPIAMRDDKLISGGCETHNCGAHNWALLIKPDGTDAQLCYKPDKLPPRWFGANPIGAAKDACPAVANG